MAIKTIETKAVISAQDQTGQTFATIAEKLKGLEHAAAAASKTSEAVGANVSSALGKSNRAFAVAAAAGGIIGQLAIRAASEAGSAIHAALATYSSVDDSRRAVKALTEQTEAQSVKMLHHALDMGLNTRFGAKEVEQSYKELAGRIQSTEVIEGITDVAAQLAMALGSDLPGAVKILENTLFATGVNVENSAEGLKKAREYSAQIMKTAKLGGFSSLADVAEAIKFPTGIASVAGISLATEGAFLAALHRGGQSGPEAGVALRQVVSALAKPTPAALIAMDAAGVHWKNYVTAGKDMSAADLSEAFERKFGRKLSESGIRNVQAMLSNPELAGDQAKFTRAATQMLGADLKPQDARQVTKVLEQFWQASISKVDVDRLLHDLIGKNLSPTQLSEIFGSKQGGRFALASRAGLPYFEQTKKDIGDVPLDYPATIAAERMAGVAGSMAKLETATENLGVRFVEANEKWLIPLFDDATRLMNAFGALDDRVLEAATVIGGLAAAAIVFRTAMGVDKLITGGAIAAGGGAVARATGLSALGAAASRLIFNPYVMGATAVGAVMKPTPTGDFGGFKSEMDRQYHLGGGGIGGGRWLSDQPPESGKFTPTPGGLGAFRLEGAASIGVRVDVGFDPGLLARQITQTLDAGGNLRADTGISMPRR